MLLLNNKSITLLTFGNHTETALVNKFQGQTLFNNHSIISVKLTLSRTHTSFFSFLVFFFFFFFLRLSNC